MFFDCNCEIGPRTDKDPAAPWSTEDVLKWMDQCSIDGALVVHTLSVTHDPVQAREMLAREVRKAPKRLFPCWTAIPPCPGDHQPRPGELIDAMRTQKVRAVKLFPKTHNWPLTVDVVGPLLETLERERILTLINFDEMPDARLGTYGHLAYATLDALLLKFPRLPVLLQRVWWSAQRMVAALMQRHRHLYIEFANYQINRGLEEYSKFFGAERLLFGSGLPLMSAGAARAFVDYAMLSKKQKELIAGGNLARLLGVQPAARPALKLDPLRARAAAGKPVKALVLDGHSHILQEGASSAGGYLMYKGDADGLVEMKDLLGIRKTAIMSWSGPIACDPVEGNDVIVRAIKRHPERFLGMLYINPLITPAKDLKAQMRKRIGKEGWVGLKPYPRTGLKYNDPLYAPCWEYANEKRIYSLLHTGGPAGGMDVVKELAKKYPDAQWMIAHTGGSFGMARGVVAAMKECPNIWAELTLTPVTNGVIEWMVNEIGDDRILFGTDAPMRDPRPQFGWVVWADLPVETRKKILGENYQRLLGMKR